MPRRADALFELCDAALATGAVPSTDHLSLAAVHRRGWGSLYAALGMGRMDEGGLRGLLSGRPLGDEEPGDPPGLRGGRLGVAPLRRGSEPGAGILLPPQPPLRGAAHRGGLGHELVGPARLRARLVGGTGGREADRARRGRERRRDRASEGTGATATREERASAVRIRRRLRSCANSAQPRRLSRPDPGAVALRSDLLRRPTDTGTPPGRAPFRTRREVRPQGPTAWHAD
jgi:hypothetical protein